jgi:hypothetical protein
MRYERPDSSGAKGIRPEDYLPFVAAQDHWDARQKAHIEPIFHTIAQIKNRDFIPSSKSVHAVYPARLLARNTIRYTFPGMDISKWSVESEPHIGWLLPGVVQPPKTSHIESRSPLLLLDDGRCAVAGQFMVQQWETPNAPELYVPASTLHPLSVETPARLDLIHSQMQAIATRTR